MTWEELKEEAKKMGYKTTDSCIYNSYVGIYFYKDGRIKHDYETIAYKRTPDQMLAIMKALQ